MIKLSPSPNTPRLETERLRLRGHRPDDLADVSALWADPAVTRHIGPPSSPEASWARLLRYVGHWTLLGFGYWVLEERATGRYVGEAGFADFQRDMTPPLGPSPEAGWVLASWAHGKGFASEALTAMLAWGDAHFGTERTVCIIDPENAASLRLAAKHGYREIARTSYKGEPTILHERRPAR